MEDTPKAYSTLSRRPSLKQAKAHHEWGNNTLTIIVDTKKRVMVHLSQRLYNLNDIYD
jgi:hypothetical protein